MWPHQAPECARCCCVCVVITLLCVFQLYSLQEVCIWVCVCSVYSVCVSAVPPGARLPACMNYLPVSAIWECVSAVCTLCFCVLPTCICITLRGCEIVWKFVHMLQLVCASVWVNINTAWKHTAVRACVCVLCLFHSGDVCISTSESNINVTCAGLVVDCVDTSVEVWRNVLLYKCKTVCVRACVCAFSHLCYITSVLFHCSVLTGMKM